VPSAADEQARILVATAGGYLRNVIRTAGLTCPVCTTPVHDGHQFCLKCSQDRRIVSLADVVVPLTYALAGAQSGTMMRHYKDNGSAAVRHKHTDVIRRLLYVGIAGHQSCIGRVVGQPVDCRVAIPSSAARAGLHPFIEMAQGMNAISAWPQLVPGSERVGEREVAAARFAVAPLHTRFDGKHVLVLDDTWTTGSRTQSAALLLRQLGAQHVSVMTIARWIEPTWSKNHTFLKQHLVADFDPRRCPVTGKACPA
jgi:hypothetical protein